MLFEDAHVQKSAEKHRVGRTGLVASLVAVAVLAVSGLASAAEQRSKAIVRSWLQEIELVDQQLREGKFEPARRRIDRLLKEAVDTIEGGPAAARLLAMVTRLRAMAEAGLGDEEAALWDADVARSLDPAIVDLDLAPYPPPIALIADHYASADAARPPERDGPKGEVHRASDPQIDPPKKLAGRNPVYPSGQRAVRKTDKVVIDIIIGKDGILRQPRLVEGSPLLALEAFEAIRTWRFAPARLDGVAVTVYYTLTVNFRLRH